jgi:hypothetical protein
MLFIIGFASTTPFLHATKQMLPSSLPLDSVMTSPLGIPLDVMYGCDRQAIVLLNLYCIQEGHFPGIPSWHNQEHHLV